METGNYLHPWLIAIFLLIFTIMSLVGLIRLVRQRRVFGSVLLLIATVVFAYCTWIAGTA
ncbi:MAG: hypothetical protein IRZ33_09960 [Alicyclobacillaceae bacterium]|nr:hypothetical protein [Alicyclobacillaceae bacterium]